MHVGFHFKLGFAPLQIQIVWSCAIFGVDPYAEFERLEFDHHSLPVVCGQVIHVLSLQNLEGKWAVQVHVELLALYIEFHTVVGEFVRLSPESPNYGVFIFRRFEAEVEAAIESFVLPGGH